MKKLFGKKGQLATLQTIVITLVTIGVVLGIGFLVLEGFQSDMVGNSSAYNATGSVITALNVIPSWLDTIVLLAVVGVLLYIVFAVLPRAGGGTAV